MPNLALPIITATLIYGGVAHAGVYSHRDHLNHGKSASVAVKSQSSAHVVRASWYGGGERLSALTANGEHFASDSLTAAHRSLPFGTRIQVTNVRTGQSAVVRINDRDQQLKPVARSIWPTEQLTPLGFSPSAPCVWSCSE